jgi:very-short-patch-repair endonuclease
MLITSADIVHRRPGRSAQPAAARQPDRMSAPLSDDCAWLLDQQHGVIARWQAAAVGLDLATVDTLLRGDRWRQLYRGIYATYTGNPPRQSQLWAGALRAGPGAALSHHTAAELDRLTDRPSKIIHVTVGHDRRVRIAADDRHELAPRIVVHRSGRIDFIRHPARTPPRTRIEETVLDLTQVSASFDDAFSWLSRGCGRRLVTPQLVRAAVGMRRRVRWRDEILGALPLIADGVHSYLEYRYVRDVEQPHGLPTAERQAKFIRGVRFPRSQYLDNLYESFGVVAELDGSAAHLVEDRWRDIHRDNFFARLGIVTLRFSWTDVTRRPCAVALSLRDVLRRRGWTGETRRCTPHCALLT